MDYIGLGYTYLRYVDRVAGIAEDGWIVISVCHANIHRDS